MCFVCGIDRNTFDRKHPIGFEYHMFHEHNCWDYLAFTIHLRQKRKTEYTGPESYVAEKLERKELDFYPILKTSSIVFEDQVSNEALLDQLELNQTSMLAELNQTQEALQRVAVRVRLSAHVWDEGKRAL